MNINTRDLSFLNFNGTEMQWLKYNNLLVWEAWKKLLTSGIFPLTLNKCKGVDLVNYKIYGESVQESDNLFDETMTLTKGIYLKNTGSETTHASWNITDYIEVNGHSFTLSNVGGNAPSICAYDENKNFITGVSYGTDGSDTKTSVTISSTTLIKYIRFSVYNAWISDKSVNDITLTYPPTPETPIEVESVGDKTKNLFGNYEIVEGKYINSTGVLTDIDGINTYRYIPVEPNTTYTISGKSDSKGYIRVAEYDESKVFIKRAYNSVMINPVITITTSDTTKYLALCPDVNFTDGTVTNSHIYDIQIEEGSQTDYEPYGYRIPVKVTQTLYDFNPENIATYNYTETAIRPGFDLGVLSAGNYVFDWELVNNSDFPTYIYLRWRYEDGTYSNAKYITTEQNMLPISFTADGTSNYYIFFAHSGVSLSGAKTEWGKVKNAYLQKGNEIQRDTTNIYLDEPLRKIGDVEDYIDFETGKVVRKIKEVSLDGTTNISIHSTTDTYRQFAISKNTYLPNATSYSMLLSSYLNQTSTSAARINNIYLGTNNFNICLEPTYTIEKVEELFNNNPIQIVYILTEEDPQPIELPNIPTHKGITILEVDTKIQPSNAEVIYMGKP